MEWIDIKDMLVVSYTFFLVLVYVLREPFSGYLMMAALFAVMFELFGWQTPRSVWTLGYVILLIVGGLAIRSVRGPRLLESQPRSFKFAAGYMVSAFIVSFLVLGVPLTIVGR